MMEGLGILLRWLPYTVLTFLLSMNVSHCISQAAASGVYVSVFLETRLKLH